MSDLAELDLITQFTSQQSPGSGVLLGVGDDAAVLDPGRDGPLVVAADLLVEGIHFDRRYTPPAAIGHKVAAVNLSDLAAMGALPRWLLLSMAIPSGTSRDWLLEMGRGLRAVCEDMGVTLVGGDTTGAKRGALTLNVTALGVMAGVAPITRRGATAGDGIYVCGTLGGAAYALSRLEAGEPGGDWAQPLFFPRPLVREGRVLASRGIPSSMIDVSDGLGSDLIHLLNGGSLGSPPIWGAEVELDHLPISPWVRDSGIDRSKVWPWVVNGGEDYALLFTVPPERQKDLAAEDLPPWVRIGTITPGTTLRWYTADKGSIPELGKLWNHFEKEHR